MKRNHLNVKLLRGYGISITKKDNKITLKNGNMKPQENLNQLQVVSLLD